MDSEPSRKADKEERRKEDFSAGSTNSTEDPDREKAAANAPQE